MADPTRHVLVKDGIVINAGVLWDGDAQNWSPPPGTIAVPSDRPAAAGWAYDEKTGGFTEPARQAPVPTDTELLLDKLVEKGTLTSAEATAIKDGSRRAGIADDTRAIDAQP